MSAGSSARIDALRARAWWRRPSASSSSARPSARCEAKRSTALAMRRGTSGSATAAANGAGAAWPRSATDPRPASPGPQVSRASLRASSRAGSRPTAVAVPRRQGVGEHLGDVTGSESPPGIRPRSARRGGAGTTGRRPRSSPSRPGGRGAQLVVGHGHRHLGLLHAEESPPPNPQQRSSAAHGTRSTPPTSSRTAPPSA